MNVRRTEVDWDPTLMRIEYLDDKGQPYYCSFEKNANGRPLEVAPVGAGCRSAENFPKKPTVLAGGSKVESCRH